MVLILGLVRGEHDDELVRCEKCTPNAGGGTVVALDAHGTNPCGWIGLMPSMVCTRDDSGSSAAAALTREEFLAMEETSSARRNDAISAGACLLGTAF